MAATILEVVNVGSGSGLELAVGYTFLFPGSLAFEMGAWALLSMGMEILRSVGSAV